MLCEVCGRQIFGKPYRAIIEGAKMTVCKDCAELGSASWEVMPKPPPVATLRLPRRLRREFRAQPKVSATRQPSEPTEGLELVEDYNLRVRQAREKLGLSHEDLGIKLSEKVSVLRKIEGKKMTPSHRLASKLENALRIKLLVPPSEPKLPSAGLSQPREVTLGEIAHLKERKREVNQERGPS